MSSQVIIAVAVGIGCLLVAWLLTLPNPAAQNTTPPLPTVRSDADRQKRAKQFFEGDPNRDVRGGQEMRPKW